MRSTPGPPFSLSGNSASVTSGISRSIANDRPSRAGRTARRRCRPRPRSPAARSRTRTPSRSATPYWTSGERDRRLHEPDVPGPEREDRRDVHQHEHEARGGKRHVDVERAHRHPDGEELAQPAEALEEDRAAPPAGRAHHGEPWRAIVTSSRSEPRPSSSSTPAAGVRRTNASEEEAEADRRGRSRSGLSAPSAGSSP